MSENSQEVEVKLYLNGFPKAGTHALNSLAMMVLPSLTKANWLGNIQKNAFSTSLDSNGVVETLDQFYPGRFARGHMAYTPEIAEAFQRNKICKVLIFRDFRDVAVSTVFHSQKENVTMFPEKEFYRSLPFDEVLRRVITGDEHISSVMDRWEQFAPWLEEDWALKISYEDFREHPEGVAGLFIRYVYGKAAAYIGRHMILDKNDFDNAVQRLMLSINHPEASGTFRKGKIGEWKKYFTEEHKELFKASDKNNWLIRLGYEHDRNW
jgi:hypothetical protein